MSIATYVIKLIFFDSNVNNSNKSRLEPAEIIHIFKKLPLAKEKLKSKPPIET